MNKKRIWIVSLCCVAVILLSAVLEIVAKKIIILSRQEEEIIYPTISDAEKEEETQFIKETNGIVRLLQKRDYETIYNRFPQIYKEAMYPTFADFEARMNDLIQEDSTIKLKSYLKTYRGYYATIAIDGEKELTLTIKGTDEDTGDIVLDNLYVLFETNMSTHTDEVKITMKYCAQYADRVGYIFLVRNLTSQTVKVNFSSSYIEGTGKLNNHTYNLMEEKELSIPGNAVQKVELQFPVSPDIMFPPDKLYLDFEINETDIYEHIFNILFEKDSDEE